MIRQNYIIELADNGMIVGNSAWKSKDVYQAQNGDYSECYKRALSDSIVSYIVDVLLNGSEKLDDNKYKYNIKIEIR